VLERIAALEPSSTVVLSGDVHVAIGAELAEDPSQPPIAVEFVNTSLTSQNLDDKMGWPIRTESLTLEAALLEGMPHFKYVDLDSHGYSIVDVDRERLRFEWWTVEGLDERTTGQTMSAALAVRHGVPRIVEAEAPG
jgi:alkaline phosphatase D